MIRQISIAGFKCLRNVKIDTANLNVLVGPNASGKSSVIQSLLLLRQSANDDGSVEQLHLSGTLYEAGTVNDVLHPAAEHQIKLGFIENDIESNLQFYHERETESPESKRLIPARSKGQLPIVLCDRFNGFAYLNAERIGPRVTYALPPDYQHLGGLVGKHGEYTAAVLARASFNNVNVEGWNENLINRLADAPRKMDDLDMHEDLNNAKGRLDLVCNVMLNWVIPGAVFEAKEFDQTDSATLRFVRDPLQTKTSVRSTHIGFGLVYTLPIVTAALALKSESLLLIENPEAHLHPFSQSRIGVFLALMASTGKQIFLETHSDHVVNGIRLAISRGIISADKTRINFFSRPINGDTANVIPIRPLHNGRLDKWPQGFFDQIESDLSKL